jgi:hypothetical protein
VVVVVEDTMNRKVVVEGVVEVDNGAVLRQANNMRGVLAEAQVIGEVVDRMIGDEEGVTIGEADEEVDTATKSLIVAGYKRGNRKWFERLLVMWNIMFLLKKNMMQRQRGNCFQMELCVCREKRKRNNSRIRRCKPSSRLESRKRSRVLYIVHDYIQQSS